MIQNDQTIPCPICATKIPFDTQQLLQGKQFTCPTCLAVIGLSTESRGIVEETMHKLDDLKHKLSEKK